MKLSIQVSLDGLSFCILNTETNSIVYYHKKKFESPQDPVNLLQKIEEEYNTQPDLTKPVDEVNLCFCNTLFTLVPEKWFQEEATASYLKFNTKILKTDFIAFDKLQVAPIVNVYVPYTNIINYFFEKYGEFEYTHHLSILLEKFLAEAQNKSTAIYAHNKAGRLDIIVIEDSKLVLCNSFNYTTKEDYLYYLLFVAEQLDMDPKKFHLNIIGEIHKEDSIYQLLHDYVQHIDFLKPNSTYKVEEGWKINKAEEYILLNML